MKILFFVATAVFLSGCVEEDNSDTAMFNKYIALKTAYNDCIGDLRYSATFEQRLACTQAVYGGEGK
jgi:outer membrane lipoprotein-sorting protein